MSRLRLSCLAAALAACSTAPTEPIDAAVGDDAEAPLDAPLASDAGTPEPPPTRTTCEDSVEAVYAAVVEGTPTMEQRGEIVRCAYRGWISQAEATTRLATRGVAGVMPTSGVHQWLVAYRTTRRGDVPALGTAEVLLPAMPATTPMRPLVAAHGTTGIADVCAPSRVPGVSDYLALPWAATGWAVIAPDYAGLGNAGVQGYGDNDDTGRSTLDAARALRALLPADALDARVVMTGHSQGGGAVLSAQALEPSYGAGGELALVIPFAPGWASGRSVDGYRFPAVPTSFGGGAPAAIASIFLYAWASNTLGAERAGEPFAASVRAPVLEALERDCVFMLASSLPSIAPTFGQLLDETFRAGVVSCADGGPCSGAPSALWDWQAANVLASAAGGAEVLLVTGTADTLATPADVSCTVAHMTESGVTPRVCVDGSTHFDVVERNTAFAMASASAMLDSADPPACPGAGVLPACAR